MFTIPHEVEELDYSHLLPHFVHPEGRIFVQLFDPGARASVSRLAQNLPGVPSFSMEEEAITPSVTDGQSFPATIKLFTNLWSI